MRYIIDNDSNVHDEVFLAHVEDSTGKHVACINACTIEELMQEGFITSRYDYVAILGYVAGSCLLS